jgi:hypothetical protein
MPEQIIRAPNYYDREINLSAREAQPSGIPAGVIGASLMGPAFVPTELGSYLDFQARFGLENKYVGLPIIQSVENNLRIIYGIQGKFELRLDKLYQTQFNTLSWYFHKTDKVDQSFIFNLEQVQELLLNEINGNLEEKVDCTQIIDLYVRLVQQHFEKVSVGYGYNHPRVIEKLIHLGLILTKYD